MVRLVDSAEDVLLLWPCRFLPRVPDAVGGVSEVGIAKEVEMVRGAIKVNDAAGVCGDEHFAMEGGGAVRAEVTETFPLFFTQCCERGEFPEISTAVVGRIEDGERHGSGVLSLTVEQKAIPIVLTSFLLLTACRGPEAMGGGRNTAQVVQEVEREIRSARVEQEVLKRKGEIVHYQLRLLEEEQNRWEFSDVPERREQWRRTRAELMALLHDERIAEFRIREALRELWEAQEGAVGWSQRYDDAGREGKRDLAWPVDTIREISSAFLDPEYEERFGIAHEGIDIPVLQGTEVMAAADGVVRAVSDRGQGFNSLTLVHDDGLVTLYGHVSRFRVTEGQRVRQGDPIARSGGEPGTPGAGLLSTGQHLHFEVIINGKHVDPLQYLQ